MAEGAEILWVLEQDPSFGDGTAEACMDAMDAFGSEDQGWCVGDDQTEPAPDVFDDSPFSEQRGFDIIVERGSMVVVYSTSHGTPEGNDNLDGEDLLAAVKQARADLR